MFPPCTEDHIEVCAQLVFESCFLIQDCKHYMAPGVSEYLGYLAYICQLKGLKPEAVLVQHNDSVSVNGVVSGGTGHAVLKGLVDLMFRVVSWQN